MGLKEYVDSIGDDHMVIDMIVGALQRVLVFPDLGLAIPQDVPADVVEAYERLCRAGFTSRLLPAEMVPSPLGKLPQFGNGGGGAGHAGWPAPLA
ncbi:hypothetical protein [Streptomyces sp. NPDC001658]